MNCVKNIVVGTDFSDNAKWALKHALRLARWNDASINILHVVDPLDINTLPEVPHSSPMFNKDLILTYAARALENWTRGIAGGDCLHLKVAMGSPIQLFLEHIRLVNCDLAILGVHGLNHPDEPDLGILATRVLHKAPCKVMLVTQEREQKFRRIVACIDFSYTAKEVAEQALNIAAKDQSEILFLHVFGLPSKWFPYAIPELESPPDAVENLHAGLCERLREFVTPPEGVACKFEVVEAYNYGDAIVRYAIEKQADLIVVGTKGKSNLSYVLLGSTAERLLRALPCSALVVKPH